MKKYKSVLKFAIFFFCTNRPFNTIFFFNFSYNRLEKIRKMRWEFGSVLPADIKYNLNEQEVCLTFLSLYDLSVLVYHCGHTTTAILVSSLLLVL